MKNRLAEIDVFRGLAVIVMIIVDAPPDFNVIYPILTHSSWQGITIADLAFPSFVFAMGMSAALSIFRKPLRMKKTALRVITLFCIGLFFNALSDLMNWLVNGMSSAKLYEQIILHGRILGVLQRLALTYLFGLILCRLLKTDTKIICAAFSMMILTSIGFHAYNPALPFDKIDNLSRAVDIAILGAEHIYQFQFDPEGLYGTINSTATMMIGVVCGNILVGDLKVDVKVRRMLICGAIMMMSGCIWSTFDIISKPLWTAPFVLLTSGGSFIVVAMLMRIFDKVGDIAVLKPIQAVGMNPLFFYLVTNAALIFLWAKRIDGVPAYYLIWCHTTKDLISPAFGAAIFTVVWCMIWLPFAEFFYRKNIVIKL